VRSAHLIRQFREPDMPVAEVKAVLEAPSESARNLLAGVLYSFSVE
jgi:hypothetical protein